MGCTQAISSTHPSQHSNNYGHPLVEERHSENNDKLPISFDHFHILSVVPSKIETAKKILAKNTANRVDNSKLNFQEFCKRKKIVEFSFDSKQITRTKLLSPSPIIHSNFARQRARTPNMRNRLLDDKLSPSNSIRVLKSPSASKDVDKKSKKVRSSLLVDKRASKLARFGRETPENKVQIPHSLNCPFWGAAAFSREMKTPPARPRKRPSFRDQTLNILEDLKQPSPPEALIFEVGKKKAVSPTPLRLKSSSMLLHKSPFVCSKEIEQTEASKAPGQISTITSFTKNENQPGRQLAQLFQSRQKNSQEMEFSKPKAQNPSKMIRIILEPSDIKPKPKARVSSLLISQTETPSELGQWL